MHLQLGLRSGLCQTLIRFFGEKSETGKTKREKKSKRGVGAT